MHTTSNRRFTPEIICLIGSCSVSTGLFLGHFPALMSVGAVLIFGAGLLKRNPKAFFQNRFALFTGLLFAMNLFNGFWCDDTQGWLNISFRKISLLLIPFGLACCPITNARHRLWIYSSFLLSAFAVTLATLINYFIHKAEYDHDLIVSKQIPVPTGIMHIQFAVLIAFAVLLCFVIWQKSRMGQKHQIPQLYSSIFPLLGLFLLVSLHILCSRTGWAALYAGVLVLLVQYLLQERKWLTGLIALAASIILPVAAYNFSGSFKNRLDNTTEDIGRYFRGEYHGYYSVSMRFDAWKCCWEVSKQHPLSGVGCADVKKEMLATYPKLGMNETQYVYEAHNQFLQELVAKGIIGLLLLLTGLFVLLSNVGRSKLQLAFVAVIIASFLFENMLEHQAGLAFYALFGMLVLGEQFSQSGETPD
ncbi:MAG: hypothetical protein EXR21_02370 [Flavobacteriaceae bacterium]|nr:hypothetical protein [Flavobacteriaceae bacterium]